MALTVEEVEAILRLRDKLTPGLEKAKSSLQSFGASATKIGAGLSAFLTLPILGVGAAVLSSAMDAEEAENLFSVSFGDMADRAREWSKKTDAALISTGTELRSTTAMLFTMFDSMGIGKEAAFDMSTGMVQLAADMSSFYNIPMKEAFDKLRAGLVGSSEPLMALGIDTRAVTVEATALRHGLIKQGQEMTTQQKVMATGIAILEQTKKAQGDLARTQDSATNTIKAMEKEVRQMKQDLGDALLPVFKDFLAVAKSLVPYLQDGVKWFKELSPEGKNLAIGIAAVAAAIGPLLIALGSLALSLPLIKTALLALTGPLGLVAAGVALAVVVWYDWDKITAYFGNIYREIEGYAKAIYDAIKMWLVDKWDSIIGGVKGAIDNVTGLFKKMGDVLVFRSVVPDMVDAIRDEFKRMGSGMSEETKKAQDEITEAFRAISAASIPLTAKQKDLVLGWEKMGISTSTMAKALNVSEIAIKRTIDNFNTMKVSIDVVYAATVDFGNMFPTQMRLAADATEAQAIALGLLKEPIADARWGLGDLGAFAQDEMPPKISTFWKLFQSDAKSGLGALTKDLDGMTDLFKKSFTGGGGALGAVKSFATGAAEKVLGMIPLVGPFISQFAGPMIAGIKKIGTAVKNLFGGPDKKEIAGRDVTKEFTENIDTMLTEAQKVEAGNEGWKKTVIVVRDAYLALGKTEKEALADVEAMWKSEKKGADAARAAIAPIEDALKRLGLTAKDVTGEFQELSKIQSNVVRAGKDVAAAAKKGGYDVPEYATGGMVEKTGLAFVHQGEFVVPKGGAAIRGGGGGASDRLLREIKDGLDRQNRELPHALMVAMRRAQSHA